MVRRSSSFSSYWARTVSGDRCRSARKSGSIITRPTSSTRRCAMIADDTKRCADEKGLPARRATRDDARSATARVRSCRRRATARSRATSRSGSSAPRIAVPCSRARTGAVQGPAPPRTPRRSPASRRCGRRPGWPRSSATGPPGRPQRRPAPTRHSAAPMTIATPRSRRRWLTIGSRSPNLESIVPVPTL